MKNLLSYFFIAFLFVNCSSDSEIQQDENSGLSEKFQTYLAKYSQSNNAQKNVALYNQLDHSSNYENSIYNLIMDDPKYNPNNSSIFSSNCGYTKHNQFDKDLIENVLNELKVLDATNFFSKMDYFENFIKNQVTNPTQKVYLLSSIEEFKWISYSAEERYDFDSCLDDCMDSTIDENLGDANWIEWGIFLATAAETTAGWVVSCSWDCL